MERYPASGAVIITGAAQGIGRRMALTLVAEGVDVCIADWNEERGNSVATEPTPGKGRRIFVKTDVADEASCATVVAKTVEAFGGAFGLVNNASIFSTLKMRPFWEIPSDEWDRVQKVNLTGVFNMTLRSARAARRLRLRFDRQHFVVDYPVRPSELRALRVVEGRRHGTFSRDREGARPPRSTGEYADARADLYRG